jgi:Family of unknown function (DUF6260)
MIPNRTDISRLGNNAPPALRALIEGRITVAQFRAMRPLPENAQKLIDNAVIRVGMDRLSVVADLLAEGMTYDLGQNFWGITQIQWDEINEAGGAHRTMEPRARGENFIVDRQPVVIPVYLTWDSFELGIRTLSASQRAGAPLDTTLIEQATRRVNEGLEDAAINGIPVPVFGSAVPGMLNAPNVNAFTYASNEAWDAAGKTGQEIINDVLGMIAMARADKMWGPYNLYIPGAYGVALNKNFTDGVTTFPITVRARIEEMIFGGRNIRVREADMLPANRTILMQMTSSVMDLVTGQEPTVISWDSEGGLGMNWLVLACMVPRVKSTFTDQSGIVTGNI